MARGLVQGEEGHMWVPAGGTVVEGAMRAASFLRTAFNYTKDALGRLSGKQFPTITRLNRLAGEAVSAMHTSGVAAKVIADDFGDKIFGVGSTEEFDRRVWSTMLEMSFRHGKQAFLNRSAEYSREAAAMRAQGNQVGAASAARDATAMMQAAQKVVSFIGPDMPNKTEADFQASLADPKVQGAIGRYKSQYVPEHEKIYRLSQGMDEHDPINSFTQIPDMPMFRLAIRADEPITGTTMFAGGGQGNLKNLKLRRDPASYHATLAAGAYELDGRKAIEKDLAIRYPLAMKAQAFRATAEAGLGRFGRGGQQVEDQVEVDPYARPPKGTQEAGPGENAFYVNKEIAGEFRKSLAIDKVEGYQKALQVLNTVPTIAALSSGVEMESHGVNLVSALFTNPSGAWHGGLGDLIYRTYQRIADFPAFRSRLVDLAKKSAMKPPGLESGSWTGLLHLPERAKFADPTYYAGRLLDIASEITRVTLSDWAQRQIKQGRAVDTITNERDFINQSVGNYFKNSQNGMVKWLRDTGIGPFATAATTFTVQGVKAVGKAVGLSSNLQATNWRSAVIMRAEVMAKMAAVLSAGLIYNYFKWGRVDGDEQTPLFGIKLGTDANGRTSSIDLSPLVQVKRGMRLTGMLAYIEAKRQGKTEGQAEDADVRQAVRTLSHPAMGPLVQFAHTAVTGEDVMGRNITEKPKAGGGPAGMGGKAAAAPKEAQWPERVKAALRNINPSYAAATGAFEPNKEVPLEEKISKQLGPFGIQYRSPARGKGSQGPTGMKGMKKGR